MRVCQFHHTRNPIAILRHRVTSMKRANRHNCDLATNHHFRNRQWRLANWDPRHRNPCSVAHLGMRNLNPARLPVPPHPHEEDGRFLARNAAPVQAGLAAATQLLADAASQSGIKLPWGNMVFEN